MPLARAYSARAASTSAERLRRSWPRVRSSQRSQDGSHLICNNPLLLTSVNVALIMMTPLEAAGHPRSYLLRGSSPGHSPQSSEMPAYRARVR